MSQYICLSKLLKVIYNQSFCFCVLPKQIQCLPKQTQNHGENSIEIAQKNAVLPKQKFISVYKSMLVKSCFA